MRKLIAIDLDGTLLNDDLVLPPFSAEVLRKLSSQGFLVVLATGRPFRALKSFYEEIGSTSPVICYNGALAFDPKNPSFPALKEKFSKDEIVQIYLDVSPYVSSFMCETHQEIHRTVFDSYLDHYFPYKGMKITDGPIDKTLHDDVYTTIMRSEKKNNEAIEASVLKHPNILFRHWTESPYSECFLKGVDKGKALTHIMDYYHIESNDVYAFGDSNNDLEMLEVASFPFAMKGSKSTLLKKSFPLTEEGHNDEGVAKTLQNLFLK